MKEKREKFCVDSCWTAAAVVDEQMFVVCGILYWTGSIGIMTRDDD